ncbi:MAG TPA: PspA/IM30 family protein [Microbacteriaceae bacterium]|nr:PspA/IM30 family protein [Microbacteriaceae bacterium]
MAKQSIFGRIGQLLKANVNALIDAAEDPQIMLDQLVRDYDSALADAESAIATTIGNLRLMEQDHAEDLEAAADWGRKALAASTRADQFRAQGDQASADKFDNLAKVALGKQIAEENEAKAVEPTIASQTEVVDKLKAGLEGLRGKRQELVAKRDELVARAKAAAAQAQVADAIKSIDVMDPTSDLGRFEEKIRREEARVLGQQEIAASTLDAQFEALEDNDRAIEIEARLAELKVAQQKAIGAD